VQLIESGLSVAEVALPLTEPPIVERLAAVNMGSR